MSFLALFVEENFATAEFIKTSQAWTHAKTWYLPKESLKTGLTNYCKDHNVEKVFLIDRFTKKILKFRLGGSVAIVTAPGLGRTHELTMQGSRDDSRLKPETKPSLSSEELRFEVLDDSKLLSEVEPKLKLMGCKRIFIYHEKITPSSAIAKELQSLGYEVLIETFPSSLQEIRSKILGLSIQGTLEDLSQEIIEALGENCEIQWCSNHGFSRNDAQLRSDFLHAWPTVKEPTLWISWDQCYLLQPDGEAKILSTGLGSVFDFESSSYRWSMNEGLEPGPLCFGRGQKLLALDLLVNSLSSKEGLADLIQKEKFETKFKSVWKVCQKFHPKANVEEIKKEWLVQLIAEAKVLSKGETLRLSGPALKIVLNEFPAEFFKKMSALKIDKESSLTHLLQLTSQGLA